MVKKITLIFRRIHISFRSASSDMNICESEWVYLDRTEQDELDDAESVSSILTSSVELDLSLGGIVALDPTERIDFKKSDLSSVSTLMIDLTAEEVRLREHDEQLCSVIPDETISDQVHLYEVIGCIFDWLVDAFQSVTPGIDLDYSSHNSYSQLNNSSSPPTFAPQAEEPVRANSLIRNTPVVNPVLIKFASVHLKAGRVMGSLFRPDLTSISLRQRLRQRDAWVKTF